MKRTLILILFVLLVGCGTENLIEKPQNIFSDNTVLEDYPYANSTDIYTSTERYTIDGTNRETLYLGTDELDYSVLYVNDEWLYYYDADDEGTGTLRRIPLHKGKDGRDIVDIEKKEVIRDTQHEKGFTIVGNYYVGISYGTVGILHNMDTGETVRQNIPEELLYSKNIEGEDKKWYVLAQGNDWVLWGGNGMMLQKIPSGEISALEEEDNTATVASDNNYIIYAVNKHSCYQYDVEKNKKKAIAKAEQIGKALCQGLDISQKEIDSFSIDNIMVNDYRIYLQLKVKTIQKNIIEQRYVILSQNREERGVLSYDTQLNSVLKNNFVRKEKKMGKKTIYRENSSFVLNIGELWFIKSKHYYCYDEKTNSVKEIDKDDREWNICYAVCEGGLEDIC